MLQWEHSAILLTFIKLPFAIKTFVLSIFECYGKTGFILLYKKLYKTTTYKEPDKGYGEDIYSVYETFDTQCDHDLGVGQLKHWPCT